MLDERYRWIVISVIIIAVLGAIYYGTLGFVRRDKTEVVFNVLPTYATISVDGKNTGRGSQFLGEGTYQVKVSAEGFKETTLPLHVVKGEKQAFLASLLPNGDTGEKWVRDHSDLYHRFEDEGATKAREEGEKQRNNFPVIDLLPYEDERYTIGYKMPKEDMLVITIRATSSLDRQLALSRIKSWGYDPADYRVDFIDYQSPFAPNESDKEGEQHDR